jgi:hypothetical protein
MQLGVDERSPEELDEEAAAIAARPSQVPSH